MYFPEQIIEGDYKGKNEKKKPYLTNVQAEIKRVYVEVRRTTAVNAGSLRFRNKDKLGDREQATNECVATTRLRKAADASKLPLLLLLLL
ncbi:MAG: hypothetical protein ABJK83_00005 [Parasphingorhabdus sp.]|uniref:hypothetical protein n=1 Tax=Parasphingorhabdus sp. TaxID=2709688 RepID=UPI0032987620